MTDAPPPPTPSTDAFAGVPAALSAALSKRGIEKLTAVQAAVVAHLGESPGGVRNLRISSQTGSGKTVALGIALARTLLDAPNAPNGEAQADTSAAPGEPRALVITPTRELANQVHGELAWLFAEARGVHVDSVTGGTDVRREQQRLRRRAPRILVGTPGRLLDHLKSGALDTSALQQVVLDEADQMLDMGFKDELDAIVERLPASRQSHLVSATFPPAVHRLAKTFQGEAIHLEGTALGQANADIEHLAYLVRPRERYDGLVNLLLQSFGERCLIFVRTRAETSELAESLAGDGFGALPFSGELPQAQRTRTLSAFRNGTINILVATDVAARGIDVPDIATVIHTDVPGEPDVYTHRSGRTGRAGKSGKSLLLVPTSAESRVQRLLYAAKIQANWQPIPSAKKIRQAVTKATRRDFYERLEGLELEEAELEYARGLLEKLPADRIISLLLRMAETHLPRPPADIQSPTPRNGPPGERRPAAAPGPRPRPGRDGFVRFSLSWGSRHGATPARCMSHVCRRGALSREQIGAIDVGVNATVIEISHEVADELERRCKRPDPRDPHVRISREGASARPPLQGPRRYDAAPRDDSGKQRPAFKRDGPRVQRAARARHTTPRTPEP